MKVWIDLLTPKQFFLFKVLKERLEERGHNTLITSRNYREILGLTNIINFNLKFVGKHGGGNLIDKLNCSTDRIKALIPIVEEFKPDVTISFCSPEACRVAFGLGIPNITINDSPHSEKVMRLTLPLSSLHFSPWIIPYKAWTKFGIDKDRIIKYKALDPIVWINRDRKPLNLNFDKKRKKILIRLEESQASYLKPSNFSLDLLKNLVKFKEFQILILPRYEDQMDSLKAFEKESNVLLIKEVVDGLTLLDNIDLLIGSGGTMCLEGALLGIPTIHTSDIKNLYVIDYLAKKGLIFRSYKVDETISLVLKLLKDESIRERIKEKAKRFVKRMEDPIDLILKKMQEVLRM